MARTEDGSEVDTITWRFGLTDAGQVILRGVLFVGLATLLIPAFDALSVLVCVVLLGLAVGYVYRPRIVLAGQVPERMIAGQTARIAYTLRNIGRRPAYGLRVRFRSLPETIEQLSDEQPVERLAPGQTAQVMVTLQLKHRGCYRIEPPVCESSFPFNLFRFGCGRGGEESLIVLPTFSLLDLTLAGVSRPVTAGYQRLAGQTGTSPEYIGNRPYQPGDPPRRIDVRAWARLAAPATKEYDVDLDNRVALVLDTRPASHGRKPGLREADNLEAAVSLCASMAYTLHRDCLIDWLLAGADLHSFTAASKTARLDRIHETLAGVEPSAGYTAEELVPVLEDRLGETSEIICILLQWDGTYQPLVEWAERAGCHCTLIVVGETDSTDCGLRIADFGSASGGESAIRNPQSAMGDIRFVSADEILTGRSALHHQTHVAEAEKGGQG